MSAELDSTVADMGPAGGSGQRGARRTPLVCPGALGRALAGLGRRLAAAADAGRGERILTAMCDHRLRDLGLDRTALDRTLRLG